MDLKLPKRPESGHKGTFGTIVIYGGMISDQAVMLGGPALSARAALRSGVGLAVFLGDKDVVVRLIEMVPQAIGIGSDADISKKAKKWNSIVLGPGLGINKSNINLIDSLLKLNIPTIIDADGLNTMAEYPELFGSIHPQCILTPHVKEFKRLAKAIAVKDADKLANKLGSVVVLKSSNTLVTDGTRSWHSNSPNPALATGGTGDVLAGLIGGLLAQYSPGNLSVFECARLGVEIHSATAIRWRREHGSGGLLIEEILKLIPNVMEKMRT
ncbi:MAG TPA: NAD(P)H-hydrate dehydratase [Candidatus Saccharimonadales bacterium]|nr:NAD(P)H-hydrate dehydratase [Candidatus Saccharimonadales bacterium]